MIDSAVPAVPALVPGVAAVHDPRPPLSRALTGIAPVLGDVAYDPDSGIMIATSSEVVTASAAITTSGSAPSPETARAVADTLLSRHPEAARVSVQVRRIALG